MKIRVSPLIFVLAAVLIPLGYGLVLLSYLISIVLHEMAHALVSKKLGYTLNEIKLMPYGASLTGLNEGVKWSHEVIIAVAGPALNIVLAVLCIALWWLFPSTYFLTETFVECNLTGALFNLIPVYPLDGGRVLLATLGKKFRRDKAYSKMRFAGFFAAAVFAALFFLSLYSKGNFSLALIAVFIFLSTAMPDKSSKYERLYSMAYRSEKLKSGLVVKEIMVREDATLVQLMRMLNSNYYHRFILVDKNFKKTGEITESQIESAAAKFDSAVTARRIASEREPNDK